MNLSLLSVHRVILISSIAQLLIGCSPIPLIQSPRIDTKLAVSASIKNSGVNNVNTAEESIRKKEKFIVDEKVPCFFTVGIKNRFEFSCMVFPYLYYGMMWQGNAKANIFDIGTSDFKNLASAIFVGSAGYYGEHEKVATWYGGLSFGTLAHIGSCEFEFVAQASGSYEKEISFESKDQFYLYWLQPAIGIVCKPLKEHLLQVSAGVNYSYPLKSDVFYTRFNYPAPDDLLHTTSASGGYSFVGEVRFDIGKLLF
jgi:hypothetical protein